MSSIAIQPQRTGSASTGRPSTSSRRVQRPTSVRLTRRGRVTVLLALVLVLLVAVTVLGSQSAATDDPGTPVPTRTVEVHEGDTLWGIAAEVAAPGQVREAVHEIEELNALTGPAVSVGQQLEVPVG
jgi:LysM repeat protein